MTGVQTCALPISKIGSNAVVVKDVPANATAVGIPARILEEEKVKEEASKAKFSAYAVSDDENDPINKALQPLLEKFEKQDAELQELKAQMGEAFGAKKTVKKT